MKTIILSITITLIVNINYAKAQSAEYLREVHNIEYIYGYESPRGKKFDKHIRDSLMAVNNQRISPENNDSYFELRQKEIKKTWELATGHISIYKND